MFTCLEQKKLNILNHYSIIKTMGHLFYILLLFVNLTLIAYLSNFFKIKSIQEWFNKFKLFTKKNPEKSDFRTEDEYNLFTLSSAIPIIEFIIIIFGLLTASWYVYLVVFLSSIIIKLLSKIFEYSFFSKLILAFTLFIRICVYFFLIINHFHLHLDILKLLHF